MLGFSGFRTYPRSRRELWLRKARVSPPGAPCGLNVRGDLGDGSVVWTVAGLADGSGITSLL
jgi:hypothetical protein